MTRVLYTVRFWLDSLERAVKSFAQSAILAFGQDAADVNVFNATWENVIGFGLGAAALSILMSVASIPIGEEGSPSLIKPQ